MSRKGQAFTQEISKHCVVCVVYVLCSLFVCAQQSAVFRCVLCGPGQTSIEVRHSLSRVMTTLSALIRRRSRHHSCRWHSFAPLPCGVIISQQGYILYHEVSGFYSHLVICVICVQRKPYRDTVQQKYTQIHVIDCIKPIHAEPPSVILSLGVTLVHLFQQTAGIWGQKSYKTL